MFFFFSPLSAQADTRSFPVGVFLLREGLELTLRRLSAQPHPSSSSGLCRFFICLSSLLFLIAHLKCVGSQDDF